MGRYKTTDEEKQMAGTFRPCKQNNQGSLPVVKLSPEPPVGLTKEARAAWTVAINNAPDGLLSVMDFSVLERWARNYALYRKIAKQLDHEELEAVGADGSKAVNPLLNALVKVQACMLACERELGFTPSARLRVSSLVRDKEGMSDSNPFEAF